MLLSVLLLFHNLVPCQCELVCLPYASPQHQTAMKVTKYNIECTLCKGSLKMLVSFISLLIKVDKLAIQF